MRGQLFHHYLDRFFQLRIVTGANQFGVHVHLNIRCDPVVLHFPFAIGIPDAGAGRRRETAVHEFGGVGSSHQSAPGALSDQLADAGAMEIPRHGIAARAREFIDDHHLGSKDGALRLRFVGAVARGYKAHQRALQILDDIGGQRAAAVEAFVDDGRLLADLSEEISVEIDISTSRRVGHVDVGDASIRHLIHLAAVVLDPREIPQTCFV